MCYGAQEPKYLMRDMEERLKGVAFVPDTAEEPGEILPGGLLVRLRALFRQLKRKDPVHV